MRAHARTDEGGGGPPGDGPALRHHHSRLVEGQAQGLLSRGPGGRAPRVTALEGKSLLRDSLSCSFSVVFPTRHVPPGRCRASSPDSVDMCCDVALSQYPTRPCYGPLCILGSPHRDLASPPPPAPGAPALPAILAQRGAGQSQPAGWFSPGGRGSVGVRAAKQRLPHSQWPCFTCAGRRLLSERLQSLFLAFGEFTQPWGGAALSRL